MRPRVLWFLIISYAMVIVFSNWFVFRLVDIADIAIDAGTFIFPLTFVLSDMITEVYGYKNARLAIWTGFLFNFLFIAIGQLVTRMPSPDFAPHNGLFDQLMQLNLRVVLASCLSYFTAEPINALIVSKLKLRMHGKWMGLRFVTSTFIASGIDTVMFSAIVFYGVIAMPDLVKMSLAAWAIKTGVEVLGLPLTIRLANKLKQYEGLDIYDTHTRFNIFSLNTTY